MCMTVSMLYEKTFPVGLASKKAIWRRILQHIGILTVVSSLIDSGPSCSIFCAVKFVISDWTALESVVAGLFGPLI